MSERPEDQSRSRDRRRGGPLGEEADQSAETRREPLRRSSADDDDATQRIPTDEATRQIPTSERGGGRSASSDTQEFEAPGRASGGGETLRTRMKRAAGRGSGTGGHSVEQIPPTSGRSGGYGTNYSTGYSDVLREREAYLRDIYGGVDWLASFVGFVFTLLCVALFGTLAGALLLVPLGLRESLSGGQLTSTVITGFAVIAGVIFVAFLFGGYISGRMSRYDGARNGAMVLVWTVLIAVLLVLLSGLLGQAISGTIAGQLVGDALNFINTATAQLSALGGAGAAIGGGAALAALLGGILGGTLGSRYHREIDYTP